MAGLALCELLGGKGKEGEVKGQDKVTPWASRALASVLRLVCEVTRGYLEPSSLAVSAFSSSGSKLLQGDTLVGLSVALRPLHQVALLVHTSVVPTMLQRLTAQVVQQLELLANRANKSAHRLTLFVAPPVPIKQYNPRFEERFVPGQDMDPDRERAEKNKMRRQLRKELKGAVRELRKDNMFLEEHRSKQVANQRKVRDERAREIETFLTKQQHEAKIGSGKRSRKR